MLEPTVYGFASSEDVEDAIAKRIQSISADKKEELAQILGEAVAALNEINMNIPEHGKARHLVANALERFASGPKG
jgi:hypothetical protein